MQTAAGQIGGAWQVAAIGRIDVPGNERRNRAGESIRAAVLLRNLPDGLVIGIQLELIDVAAGAGGVIPTEIGRQADAGSCR